MNIFSGGSLQEYSATKVSLSSQRSLPRVIVHKSSSTVSAEQECALAALQHLLAPCCSNNRLKPQSIHPGDQRLHSGMQRQVIPPHQHVDQLQVEVCMLWQLIEQQILQQQWTGHSKYSLESGPSNASMQSQGVID